MKTPIFDRPDQGADSGTADLLAEQARLVADLDKIGSPGLPGFDEDAILETIDRLHEIEAVMPLEFPQRQELLDFDEVPF